MSQYIANLNMDTPPTDDLFSAHDDLSLFAQTDFFDFDMNEQMNGLPSDFEANPADRKSSTAGWQASSGTTSGRNFLDSKSHFAVNSHHYRRKSFAFSQFNNPLFVLSVAVDALEPDGQTLNPSLQKLPPRLPHHACLCISQCAPPSHNRS